jgi:hypothetical protein
MTVNIIRLNRDTGRMTDLCINHMDRARPFQRRMRVPVKGQPGEPLCPNVKVIVARREEGIALGVVV